MENAGVAFDNMLGMEELMKNTITFQDDCFKPFVEVEGIGRINVFMYFELFPILIVDRLN